MFFSPQRTQTVDEYNGGKDHLRFRSLTADLTPEKLAALAQPSAEEMRPYAGEYPFSLSNFAQRG